VVRTVVGAGTLDGPGGIALDAAGDLFVADTGHCRVVVIPARPGTFGGVRVRPGQVATVAGGSCSGTASIGHPTGVAADARGDLYIAAATAQRVEVVRPGTRTAKAVGVGVSALTGGTAVLAVGGGTYHFTSA
jgi:sugar lactone lactonase YvrE